MFSKRGQFSELSAGMWIIQYCFFQNCVNCTMKLSTWDDQVVNNFLTNNANYQDKIEDMFINNTNSNNINQKMDGDFNFSHLGMNHVNQNLNFSSFGSFLAGKYASNRRVQFLIVWPMIIWPLVVWIVWLLNDWPLIIWLLIVGLSIVWLLIVRPWIVSVVWLLIFFTNDWKEY